MSSPIVPQKPSSLQNYTPPQPYHSVEVEDPFADSPDNSVPLVQKTTRNGYASFQDDSSLPYYASKPEKSGKKPCSCPWPWWGYVLTAIPIIAAIIGFTILGINNSKRSTESVQVPNGVGISSTLPVLSTMAPPQSRPALQSTPVVLSSSILVATSTILASSTSIASTSILASQSTTAMQSTATTQIPSTTKAYVPYTPAADAYIAPFVLGPKAFPTSSPSKQWNITLGPWDQVGPILGDGGASFIHTIPDSFTPSIPSSVKPGQWIFFYSEAENRRSLGSKPFPEDQRYFEPNKGGTWPVNIFGGRNESDTSVLNGGAWLMSIARNPITGGQDLIGFWHSQDHVFNNVTTGPAGEAWKSVGVAYSKDDGITWTNGGVILEGVGLKPQNPAYGGIGDMSVNWDWKNQQWVCLFKEQLRIGVAISKDSNASPGTWYKYRGTGNTVPQWTGGDADRPKSWDGEGLGGNWSPLPSLASVPGSNPGCHFNSYLERWVCIWNSWNETYTPGYVPNSLYVSVSDDLLNWDTPRLLATPKCPTSRAWHATVISSEGGSEFSGRDAQLYYSDCWTMDTGEGEFADGRVWVSREIRFDRLD